MRKGVLHSIVALIGFTGAAVHAQTTVYPNTNVVISYATGFSQGICNDGTNTYFFDTASIQQRNSHYQGAGGLFANKTVITNGLTGFNFLHLGDPDYYRGYLYAPMESAVGVPQGAANIDVAIFNATNLIRHAAISISNYQSEASAICIDPNFSNSVALFVTSWVSGSPNDGIFQYRLDDLTNITFVRALPLSRTITRMQGMICIGGMLYVIADNGPYGDVYQVDPTNGAVTYLIQLNLPGNGEWEGLDYFQSFFIAAEGATGTVNFYDFFSSNRRIKGLVRDNHNSPIKGVGVIASALINGTNQIASVDTDTNGYYLLSVPPGSWNVTVNCYNGSDSLANFGNYLCPNAQSAVITNNDVVNNFIVTNCNFYITAPVAFPIGEVGITYNQTLKAFSCNPAFAWTIISGSLPPGLSLSSDGIVSGMPSSSGMFNFTVQVADGNNSTANQTFSIDIRDTVRIVTATLPDSAVCNIPLIASNGLPPYIWSLRPGSSPLPPNLFLTSGGLLSGSSATNGTFNFSVRVVDSLGGVANRSLTINILQALSLSRSGHQVHIVWPAWATNYVLQSSDDLINWMTVTGIAPGGTFTATNLTGRQFFRLH